MSMEQAIEAAAKAAFRSDHDHLGRPKNADVPLTDMERDAIRPAIEAARPYLQSKARDEVLRLLKGLALWAESEALEAAGDRQSAFASGNLQALSVAAGRIKAFNRIEEKLSAAYAAIDSLKEEGVGG